MEDNKWLNITDVNLCFKSASFDNQKDGVPIYYSNKVVGIVRDSGVVEIQEIEIPQRDIPHGYVGTLFHLVLAEKKVPDMGYYIYNSIRQDVYERTLVYEKVTVDQNEPNKGTAVTYRFPSGSIMAAKNRTERSVVQLPSSVVPPVLVEPIREVMVPESSVSNVVKNDFLDDIGSDDDPVIPLNKNGKPYWVVGGRQCGFVLEEGKVYKWSGISEGLYTIYRWRDEKFRVEKVKKKGVTIYDMEDNKMMDINDKYLL